MKNIESFHQCLLLIVHYRSVKELEQANTKYIH